MTRPGSLTGYVIDPVTKIMNVTRYRLERELEAYIRSFPEDERIGFFDPRNADGWKEGFAQWLQRPKEFASND